MTLTEKMEAAGIELADAAARVEAAVVHAGRIAGSSTSTCLLPGERSKFVIDLAELILNERRADQMMGEAPLDAPR